MDNNLFKNNPTFNNLSPEKLAFLMNFANAKKPTQMQEMMPFLMNSMKQAKTQNIQFSDSESNLLIEILKQNLSPEEAHKVDMMLRMMRPK